MRLNGEFVAERVATHCQTRIKSCTDRGLRPPGLAFISVGHSDDGDRFTDQVKSRAEKVGVQVFHYRFDQLERVGYIVDRVKRLIDELNKESCIDGIVLVNPMNDFVDGKYLPISEYYTTRLRAMIVEDKDVDGCRPDIMAKLANPWYNPYQHPPAVCTGIFMLLDWYRIPLVTTPVTIVGRSPRVGRPLHQMFINRNAEVTMVHSKNHPDQIWQEMKASKIIVCAAGQPNLFAEDDIDLNEHPTIIQVGAKKVEDRMVGDFNFDFLDHFGDMNLIDHTYPVGDVGPMTCTALLYQTTEAWETHLHMKGELLCQTKDLLDSKLRKEYEMWTNRWES